MSFETDVLIVGGGMATAKLLQSLIDRQCSRLVTVVCDESEIGYNRVLLPSLLAGRACVSDLRMSSAISSQPNIKLHANTVVKALDLQENEAVYESGIRLKFQTLVLALGSTVPRMEVPGIQLPGVSPMRNLDHVKDVAAGSGSILVVGGGLLGIEAADALLSRGFDVSLVHRGEHLMNRHLDSESGARLAAHLQKKGLLTYLQSNLNSLYGSDHVEQARLDNGAEFAVGRVILATGTKPNIALAADAGLSCAHGIRVAGDFRTSASNVYAIGECAQPPDGAASLVEAVHAQADALAKTLTLGGRHKVGVGAVGTHLKIEDLGVYAVGSTSNPSAADACIDDRNKGTYRRLFLERETLVGAVLVGDTRGSRNIAQKIGEKIDPAVCDALAFGY